MAESYNNIIIVGTYDYTNGGQSYMYVIILVK